MRTRFHRRLLIVPIVLTMLPASDVLAQTCDRSGCGLAICATPAIPAPSDRWGGLQPLDSSIPACTGAGPAFCRDATSSNDLTESSSASPRFMSLDTENGYLFVALGKGLQVWDARTFPPLPKSELGVGGEDVDAPAGVDDEVAVAGADFVIVDVADKVNPQVLYTSGQEGSQVYAATIGGRRYAFLASRGSVFVYDMTQAQLYDHCSEPAPAAGGPQCPGVFVGKIGMWQFALSSVVDGVDQFIVANTGTSGSAEIWDVSNPAHAQLRLPNLIGLAEVKGAALWKQGSLYYLALRSAASLYIYDVSCIASGCQALGGPVFSGQFTSNGTFQFVDFSRSDGVPFLYLGSDDRCSGGTQREWLLDVSNPASPVDISPFNYWGWYYRGGPTGFNYVTPRSGKFVGPVFYRAALSIFDFHQRTGLVGGGGAAIDLDGPDVGQAGEALTFTAHASHCSPGSGGWSWSVGNGTILSPASDGPTVSVTWPDSDNKTVSARHAACGSAVGLKSVGISGPDTLKASFTVTPASGLVGAPFTFDASGSSGGPSSFGWDFGDNAFSCCYSQVIRYPYSHPGTFTVRLTISRPGSGPGCTSGKCYATTQRVLAVLADAPPPPSAYFTTSALCVSEFGFDQCQTAAGAPVTFTAEAAAAVSYFWDFGDGTTAGGRSATHAWSQIGEYIVSLTAGNGQTTETRTKRFQVNSARKTVLIPWIAQTRGVLVQSSDLYVHNPGSSPIDATLEFRKRGLPEAAPPRQTRTIAPGATLFFADVVKELFQRDNVTGFLTVEADTGASELVVTSFNATVQGSSRFGQAVSGVTLGGPVPAVQQLVGLNDNAERLAYFGITNPTAVPASYRLRFFDAAGGELGHSADLNLPAFGQRQFQSAEIHSLFHVSGSDYRVQVETIAGGPLYPYGSNLRLATSDPSFVEAAAEKSSRAYLVGVLSAPGLFGSQWRTDVMLANPGAQALHAQLSFTSIGVAAQPTAPATLTLQPGETRRLTDVVNGQWGIHDAIGVLTLTSLEPPLGAALPVFQGESYDDARPSRRFGQSMAALGDADAAAAGQGQVLTGLRQDGAYRSILWLYNPSGETGVYDLVYRALDGTVLGRIDGVTLGPGKARQLGPGQHRLPAAGVPGGFTVQALVRAGRLLAGGQVVNNATNDPAYIRGEPR